MPIIIENGKETRVNYDESEIKPRYKTHDLDSVFSHYNKSTGLNEPVKNILNKEGGDSNGKSSR